MRVICPEPGDVIRQAVQSGTRPAEREFGKSQLLPVMLTGWHDMQTGRGRAGTAHFTEPGLRVISLLSVTLRCPGVPLGSYCTYSPEKPEHFYNDYCCLPVWLVRCRCQRIALPADCAAFQLIVICHEIQGVAGMC